MDLQTPVLERLLPLPTGADLRLRAPRVHRRPFRRTGKKQHLRAESRWRLAPSLQRRTTILPSLSSVPRGRPDAPLFSPPRVRSAARFPPALLLDHLVLAAAPRL